MQSPPLHWLFAARKMLAAQLGVTSRYEWIGV
jgi:hypothetical protein